LNILFLLVLLGCRDGTTKKVKQNDTFFSHQHTYKVVQREYRVGNSGTDLRGPEPSPGMCPYPHDVYSMLALALPKPD
jgi:hypothetical protein